VAARLEAGLTPQEITRLGSGLPRDWANDSFAVARPIYAALPDGDLPDDYARRQSAVTAGQLRKAGLRLAAVLNRVLR
jgi:hypothetical protein